MTKEQNKGVHSIRLPDEVLERVSSLAARSGESAAYILRQSIKAGLPIIESGEWNPLSDGLTDKTEKNAQKKPKKGKGTHAEAVKIGFGAHSASTNSNSPKLQLESCG